MEIRLRQGQSINAALRRFSDEGDNRLVLEAGVYREKVVVDVANIEIIGEGMVTISYGDFAKLVDEAGREFTTFRTPTMTVTGANVTLTNLTIVNDAGRGEEVGQAVALAVYGDHFLAQDCRLLAHQDTLFVGPLPVDLRERYLGLLDDELLKFTCSRQVYRRCQISGTVDFIFGAGQALFDQCRIECLKTQVTYIAAPATPIDQEGFHFRHCQIVGPASDVYLARPWREQAHAIFDNCQYLTSINKDYVSVWHGTDRHKTARFTLIDKDTRIDFFGGKRK